MVNNDRTMLHRLGSRCCSTPALLIFAALSWVAPGLAVPLQDAPLAFTTASLPAATAGVHYAVTLQASGGVFPYLWQLTNGSHLPPGLHLNEHTGHLSGTTTQPGNYHFTVALSDVNAPPAHVQRDFTLSVVAGLAIEWKAPPHVSGTWIAGSLIVANHTDQSANLTVIVVAVNQIGRATALGYQHFTIQAGSQQEIPFGSSPGPGTYVVRADVIAHFTAGKTTLRAHKQTAEGALVVEQI